MPEPDSKQQPSLAGVAKGIEEITNTKDKNNTLRG
jgi:hypothetical protein